MKTTIYSAATTFPVCYVIPRSLYRMAFHLIWTGTFNNRFEDKQYAIEVYEKHNQRVKQIVPKDRLLVLDVTKGEGNHWKQLCEFLDVPDPQVPFPRSNDTKHALNMIKKVNIFGWTIILAGTSVLAALIGVALYFYF